jgi:hypothetical protein
MAGGRGNKRPDCEQVARTGGAFRRWSVAQEQQGFRGGGCRAGNFIKTSLSSTYLNTVICAAQFRV